MFSFLLIALCFTNCESFLNDLPTTDFDRIIGSSKAAFVLFYTTWCGNSRQFMPEFEYAADLLTENNIADVFRVDLTHNTSLLTRLPIHGYPSLLLFVAGDIKNPIPYDAELASPAAMRVWVQKRTGAVPLQLRSEEEAAVLLKRSAFAVIAYFPKVPYFNWEDYVQLSAVTGEVEFAWTQDFSLAKKLKIPDRGFIFYFPHDQGSAGFMNGLDRLSEARDFIRVWKLPLVSKLGPGNSPAIVSDMRKKIILIKSEDDGEKMLLEFANRQSDLRSEFQFIYSQKGSHSDARMAAYLGEEEISRFWIVEGLQRAGDMRKFPCPLHNSTISDCLSLYRSGSIAAHVKWSAPSIDPIANVEDLTGLTFPSFLKKAPCLVLFHAPWCNECLRVMDYLQKIHTAYPNISLGRLDSSANDSPGVHVPLYPSFGLQGSRNFQVFHGDLENHAELIKWIGDPL